MPDKAHLEIKKGQPVDQGHLIAELHRLSPSIHHNLPGDTAALKALRPRERQQTEAGLQLFQRLSLSPHVIETLQDAGFVEQSELVLYGR